MYDHYVSLGYNCEVAFQFQRILGKDIAYFFNWLVTPMDLLNQLVAADFEGAFSKENLELTKNPKMILDKKYNMKYHSPFYKEMGKVLVSGSRFDEIHDNFMGKIELFKARFRQLAQSDLKTLYFIKTDEDSVREKAAVFRDIMLRAYPNHNFHVLVLQTRAKQEPEWGEDRIFNRYLHRFAPTDDAPDGHLASWTKIFQEFPLNKGAMQSPIAV